MKRNELLLKAYEACTNGHVNAADMVDWVRENHPSEYRGIPAFATEEYWTRASCAFLEQLYRRRRVKTQGDLFVAAGVQVDTGIWIETPHINRNEFIAWMGRQERNIDLCIRQHEENQRLLDLADSRGWEQRPDSQIDEFVSFLDADDQAA